MPSKKTIATELSLCFGTLGITINDVNREQMLQIRNVEDVYLDKLFDFYNEKDSNKLLLNDMWSVGNLLSPSLRENIIITPDRTEWTGPIQQSASTLVSRDLIYNELLSVSVKAESNVIFNTSPRALIIDLPKGTGTTTRGNNWYYEVAREEYQKFYSSFNPTNYGLPQDVGEFEKIHLDRKEEFKNFVKKEFRRNKLSQKLYYEMCNRVMVESANIFTNNMKNLKETPGSSNMLRKFCEKFFRINSTLYILAGIDKNVTGKPGGKFGVEIPSATDWNNQYHILDISANPKSGSGQPVILIKIKLLHIGDNDKYEFDFNLEIRWSHGKFGSIPEGKLYKDFLYNELPWAKNLLKR